MTSPAPVVPADDPTWVDIVWAQFRKRRLAYASMWGVVALLFVAIYAPLVLSSQPFVWHDADGWAFPWLATLFNRKVYKGGIDIFFNSLLFPGTLFAAFAAWRFRVTAALPRRERTAARSRAVWLATGAWLVVLLGMLLFPHEAPAPIYVELVATQKPSFSLFPPLPISYAATDVTAAGQTPSWAHWLGTDQAGSDVFARMVYGTRVSLTVGVFAVALYCTFGTFVGAIAGFFGGRIDALIMRLVEVVICIPSLFLILAVAAFIPNRSIFHIMFIIAAVAWTGPARLVRAEFLRLRELDFVAAARAAGFGRAQIIFAEILPNALGPVLVSATFGVASAILVESTMSFLGLGDPSVPSWGQVLATGRQSSAWVLILAPGFAIFATVSVLNLLGEGVRDALDPKLRS